MDFGGRCMNQNSVSYDYIVEGLESVPEPAADAQLLQWVATGDQEAFSELYRRYGVPLFNYLLRLVQDEPAAEDLLQEVFVAVWNGAARFRWQAQVKTWLFHIAHYQAVSWLRRNRSQGVYEDLQDQAGADDLEQAVYDRWESGKLRQALDQLSPQHRAVLELAFVYEMSYREIAEVVDCPVGTVKSRMNHARRLFGEHFRAMVENEQEASGS